MERMRIYVDVDIDVNIDVDVDVEKTPLPPARLCYAHSRLASNFGALSEHIFVFDKFC